MKEITFILGMVMTACLTYAQSHSCVTQEEAGKILGRPAHLSMDISELPRLHPWAN